MQIVGYSTSSIHGSREWISSRRLTEVKVYRQVKDRVNATDRTNHSWVGESPEWTTAQWEMSFAAGCQVNEDARIDGCGWNRYDTTIESVTMAAMWGSGCRNEVMTDILTLGGYGICHGHEAVGMEYRYSLGSTCIGGVLNHLFLPISVLMPTAPS